MTAPVVTVGIDDPVPKIAATLNRHRISAVPVIDSNGAVVGLVSEYDLLASPAGGSAREVMTTRDWLDAGLDSTPAQDRFLALHDHQGHHRTVREALS